mgnify:CR=1 FL=1
MKYSTNAHYIILITPFPLVMIDVFVQHFQNKDKKVALQC